MCHNEDPKQPLDKYIFFKKLKKKEVWQLAPLGSNFYMGMPSSYPLWTEPVPSSLPRSPPAWLLEAFVLHLPVKHLCSEEKKEYFEMREQRKILRQMQKI